MVPATPSRRQWRLIKSGTSRPLASRTTWQLLSTSVSTPSPEKVPASWTVVQREFEPALALDACSRYDSRLCRTDRPNNFLVALTASSSTFDLGWIGAGVNQSSAAATQAFSRET